MKNNVYAGTSGFCGKKRIYMKKKPWKNRPKNIRFFHDRSLAVAATPVRKIIYHPRPLASGVLSDKQHKRNESIILMFGLQQRNLVYSPKIGVSLQWSMFFLKFNLYVKSPYHPLCSEGSPCKSYKSYKIDKKYLAFARRALCCPTIFNRLPTRHIVVKISSGPTVLDPFRSSA